MTFRPALPSAHDLPALWAEDFGGGRVAKDAAPIFVIKTHSQIIARKSDGAKNH